MWRRGLPREPLRGCFYNDRHVPDADRAPHRFYPHRNLFLLRHFHGQPCGDHPRLAGNTPGPRLGAEQNWPRSARASRQNHRAALCHSRDGRSLRRNRMVQAAALGLGVWGLWG